MQVTGAVFYDPSRSAHQCVGWSMPARGRRWSPPRFVHVLPPARRFVLRGDSAARAAAERALGMPVTGPGLPRRQQWRACRAVAGAGRVAAAGTAGRCCRGSGAAQGLEGLAHSLVDVSHRQIGLAVSGAQAATLLDAGCPLDLDDECLPGRHVHPHDALQGRGGAVAHRREQFRLEVWRSFAAYVTEYLAGGGARHQLRQGTVAIGAPGAGLPVTLEYCRHCPPVPPVEKIIREDACSGAGHRWWRGRRQYALSPDQEGLEGRRADRAHGTHRRLNLACRGPAAAVQHELHGRPAAQVLGRPLQAPARGDRPGRQLPRHRQPAPRHQQGAHGRVPEVLRHGEHHRRALRGHHPAARQGTVAAGGTRRRCRHARARRRALPPGRWSHRPGRPHHGAAQGCARRRCGDLREHRGDGDRAHRRRRVAGAYQQGRHHRRAPGAGDRQLRPPDRAPAGPERAGDSRSNTSTSFTTNPRS